MDRFDALIVGGSFAGLSAALNLARARRRVMVVDGGRPRNRFSSESHGVLAQDGRAPAAILADARTQLLCYPTVQLVDDEAVSAEVVDGGFSALLATGATIDAARLVLAFGVRDELPPLPGLAARWGRSVLACPYCHGYEHAGRKLAVLHSGPMTARFAATIADWGPVTLLLDGRDDLDDLSIRRLIARGVTIEAAVVRAVAGPGDTLTEVIMADGRSVAADALFVLPRAHLASPIAEQLGCAFEEARLGRVLRTDEARMTTVEGVYAAGDVTHANNIMVAAAAGAMAGVALHASLVTAAFEGAAA